MIPLQERWNRLCADEDESMDLGIGALLVASLEDPNLDFEKALNHLDVLAEKTLKNVAKSVAPFVAQGQPRFDGDAPFENAAGRACAPDTKPSGWRLEA